MTANYIDPDTAPFAAPYILTTCVAPIALLLLGLVLGLRRRNGSEKFWFAPLFVCAGLALLIFAFGWFLVPSKMVLV